MEAAWMEGGGQFSHSSTNKLCEPAGLNAEPLPVLSVLWITSSLLTFRPNAGGN